jgi:putative transposase
LERKERNYAGPKPTPIELSDAERQGLEKLVKRHQTPQQIAPRARIVLAIGQGKNKSEIARQMNVTVDTIRLWRQRWLSLRPISLEDLSVEERLQDLPRRGATARIQSEQVTEIMALACEAPEDAQGPISNWTAREIADEIQRRGIVEQISPRHAARLLKRCASQAASDPRLADARRSG